MGAGGSKGMIAQLGRLAQPEGLHVDPEAASLRALPAVGLIWPVSQRVTV